MQKHILTFLFALFTSIAFAVVTAAPPVVLLEDDDETVEPPRKETSPTKSTSSAAAAAATTATVGGVVLDDDEEIIVPKKKDDSAAKAKAEQERIAREKKAEEERLAREKKAEEERLAREKKAEEERLAREKAEQERIAREKAEQERIAAEKAEQERIAAEKAEQERIAAEKAVQERIAAEKAEQERIAAEKAEQERIAAEKAEQERIAAEKAEQERIAAEKAEQERIAAEKAEQERIAAEKAEQERIAAEKVEQERIAAEKAEQERIAAEKVEQERIAREKAEQERAEEVTIRESANQPKVEDKPVVIEIEPPSDDEPVTDVTVKENTLHRFYRRNGKSYLSIVSAGYSTVFLLPNNPHEYEVGEFAFKRHFLSFQILEWRVGIFGMQLFNLELGLNTPGFTESGVELTTLMGGGEGERKKQLNPEGYGEGLIEAVGSTMWFAYKPSIKFYIPCTSWLALELYGGVELDISRIWSKPEEEYLARQNFFLDVYGGLGLLFQGVTQLPLELKTEYRHPAMGNPDIVPQGFYLSLQVHLGTATKKYPTPEKKRK